jgi:hypothetical protein
MQNVKCKWKWELTKQYSKFEIRNSKFEIQNAKCKMRNLKYKTWNSKFKIRNSKCKMGKFSKFAIHNCLISKCGVLNQTIKIKSEFVSPPPFFWCSFVGYRCTDSVGKNWATLMLCEIRTPNYCMGIVMSHETIVNMYLQRHGLVNGTIRVLTK